MTQHQYLSDEQINECIAAGNRFGCPSAVWMKRKDFIRAIRHAESLVLQGLASEPVGYADEDGRVTWTSPIPEGGAPVYAAPLSEVKAEPSDWQQVVADVVSDIDMRLDRFEWQSEADWFSAQLDKLSSLLAARQASPQQGAAQSEPKGGACSRCNGTGVVDDGEIDCYDNGEPFANGPIKCVKDCPACGNPQYHKRTPLAASAPTVGESGDRMAYEGAREDLLDWKRRALEAEALVRKFTREVNGPTFMGEPATPSSPAVEEAGRPLTGQRAREEGTQPWYDLAWASGARRHVSFMGDELESLSFAPSEFERFCTALLAVEEASSAGASGVWTHPLLAYADSYRSMAKMGDGKVSCWSVVTDIERNMIPATTPAPAPAVPAAGEQPVAWMLEGVGVNDSGSRSVHMREPKNVDARYWKVVPVYARPSAAGADEGKDAQEPTAAEYLEIARRTDPTRAQADEALYLAERCLGEWKSWVRDQLEGTGSYRGAIAECEEIGAQITSLRQRLAADAQPLEAKGWRTIETAPKDGTTILLGSMEDGEIVQRAEMQWGHVQRNGLFPGQVGMWVDPGGNFTWNPEPADCGPTHWQPLPPPPAQSEGSRG